MRIKTISRDEFELWAEKEYSQSQTLLERDENTGGYKSNLANSLWACWYKSAQVHERASYTTMNQQTFIGCECNYPNREYVNGFCNHCGGVEYQRV